MKTKILNFLKNKKKSTIDWLYYHSSKKTGESFLTLEQKNAADEFAILCEKMITNYRLSHFETFVNKGHFNNNLYLIGKIRKKLYSALQVLGKDAELTSDIAVKNFTLRMAERKYNLTRGTAKIILRNALERLVDLFYDNKNKNTHSDYNY